MKNADYWIKNLNLIPHPEGGYYREIYRSGENILREHLPERFSGNRNFSTSIYYLLRGKEFSRFHKIKSDEQWHFYSGECLLVYEIDSTGNLNINRLGLDFEKGELPSFTIKAGNWFAAKPENDYGYCLAGCTVSPGFDFTDLEIAERNSLIKIFPQHESIIKILT